MPNVFGRLLYGSRFGSGKQSRGQQGIGISAAIMYGQLTTGRSAVICTRISKEHLATKITMKLDTRNNRGNVERKEDFVWKDELGLLGLTYIFPKMMCISGQDFVNQRRSN